MRVCWGSGVRKLKEKRTMQKPDGSYSIVTFIPEPTQPYLFFLFSSADDSPLKKGEVEFCTAQLFYGRFLSINSTMTAPTTAIATIMPATEGKKYISAIDGDVGVGPGVASGAASTAKAVTACEGQ